MSFSLGQATPQRVTDMVKRVQAFNQRQLVDITRRKVRENQARIRRVFGQEAEINQYIDGQLGKPLSSAKEFTLTQFHLQSGVVDTAWKMLAERSPYGPDKFGHYRDDHWIYVNGVRRDAELNGGKPILIGPRDHVVIVNMRPYARKIEGGAKTRFRNRLTDRRPGLSVQAPNGVYEITARDLQRMFGRIAEIRFTYRGVIGGKLAFSDIPRKAVRGTRGRFQFSGGPRPGNKSENRYPSLEISARTGFS
jgi:hypothetical protein